MISISTTISPSPNPNDNINANSGFKVSLGGATLGGGLGGALTKKSSDNLECPKSPGRLIKSPKTGESKFISAGIINKSPQMQNKILNLDKKSNNNVLDILGKKKTGITVSTPKEDEIDPNVQTAKHPIRKAVVNVNLLKDNIPQVQTTTGGLLNEFKEVEDQDDNANNYEGYLYKVTKTKKLKKMYFRLIHKDMYCKDIL